MSYLRFTIDLAVKQPIPQVLQNALPEIRAKIQFLKLYCAKINAGKPEEEATIRASYHICRHDEGKLCDPEQNI